MKASGSEPRALVPARTYLARVKGVYHLGTQSGQYGKNIQFVVEFELHTRKGVARDEKGNTLTICMFVDFYLGSVVKPSKLLKLVQAAEGRTLSEAEIKEGYDMEQLLDKALKVRVGHQTKGGSTKAIVEDTAKLDEDDEAPEQVEDSKYFEIGADRVVPDDLPKFVKDFIAKSEEFGGSKKAVPATVGAGDDDDDPIPF